MIYTLSGVKGGSGRSTIAEHLAVWLSRQGFDVLFVDADDQETASDFTAWREQTLEGNIGYTLVQLTGNNLRKQVEQLRPKYDHIVIDTGGRDTTSQRAALFVCDVALIPFQPRSHDVWTLTKLTGVLNEIQGSRAEPFKTFCFLNRADLTSVDNRDAAEALSQDPNLGFVPLPVVNRKSFPNAASLGLTVFEASSPDPKAIHEIETLFSHIYASIHPAAPQEAL